MPKENEINNLVTLFKNTHNDTQNKAARSVDIALVVRNWLFGWYIVEFENGADERKILYGKELINKLAIELKKENMKGVGKTNLKIFRSFYLSYSKIGQTMSDQSNLVTLRKSHTKSNNSFIDFFTTNNNIKNISVTTNNNIKNISAHLANYFNLGWSHYVNLLTISDEDERKFYEIEAIENSWRVRELKRQIASSLYQRLALSCDKEKVKELAIKGQIIEKATDIIKDPLYLEFLDLPNHHNYSENQLETAIIDKLEMFLLELGKGFLFEARQKRFTFDDDHFYVDLVFYNRLLHCYVLIDLKRDKLTHQDLGQMQMYVNYFDRYVKTDEEAKTIGILLCHRKNDSLIELTLPKENNIYATKYELYLPTKEELKNQIKLVENEFETRKQGAIK